METCEGCYYKNYDVCMWHNSLTDGLKCGRYISKESKKILSNVCIDNMKCGRYISKESKKILSNVWIDDMKKGAITKKA